MILGLVAGWTSVSFLFLLPRDLSPTVARPFPWSRSGFRLLNGQPPRVGKWRRLTVEHPGEE